MKIAIHGAAGRMGQRLVAAGAAESERSRSSPRSSRANIRRWGRMRGWSPASGAIGVPLGERR